MSVGAVKARPGPVSVGLVPPTDSPLGAGPPETPVDIEFDVDDEEKVPKPPPFPPPSHLLKKRKAEQMGGAELPEIDAAVAMGDDQLPTREPMGGAEPPAIDAAMAMGDDQLPTVEPVGGDEPPEIDAAVAIGDDQLPTTEQVGGAGPPETHTPTQENVADAAGGGLPTAEQVGSAKAPDTHDLSGTGLLEPQQDAERKKGKLEIDDPPSTTAAGSPADDRSPTLLAMSPTSAAVDVEMTPTVVGDQSPLPEELEELGGDGFMLPEAEVAVKARTNTLEAEQQGPELPLPKPEQDGGADEPTPWEGPTLLYYRLELWKQEAMAYKDELELHELPEIVPVVQCCSALSEV